MVLMPILGSELTALVFVLVGLFFAMPLLMENKSRFGYLGFAVIVFAVVWFFPKRGELYRVIHPSYAGFKQYFTEGRDGVVMTYVNDDGTVYNYINGDSHGGRPAYSFYVQVIEAAAAAKKMDNVLVIGYGTGSITEAVFKFKNVKKVTVIELNRAVIKNLRQIPLFQNLMNDPRLEFVVDDGRRFLQSHTDRYDLIFTSPLRATTAYSNNIYSQQFFALVSKRLDKDGIFVVWSDSLDVTFRTLDAVFSYKRLYKGNSGGFYMAANERLKTERDVKTLMTMMESLGARNEQNMIEASKGVQIIPQEVLRAVIYNYLPVQDWRPFSEYYLGIWFAEHWRKQVPKDAGAKK